MMARRDYLALALTMSLIIGLATSGGGAKSPPSSMLSPFTVAPAPVEEAQMSAKNDPSPEAKLTKPAPDVAPPSPASEPRLEARQDKQAELARTSQSQAQDEKLAQQAERTRPSEPKPVKPVVIQLRANVQVTVEWAGVDADSLCASLGEEVILVCGRSLYRLTPDNSEAIPRLPKSRLCMILSGELCPSWVAQHLSRASLIPRNATLYVIIRPEWTVRIHNTVLENLGDRSAFEQTFYDVTSRLESGDQDLRFTVVKIDRRPFKNPCQSPAVRSSLE